MQALFILNNFVTGGIAPKLCNISLLSCADEWLCMFTRVLVAMDGTTLVLWREISLCPATQCDLLQHGAGCSSDGGERSSVLLWASLWMFVVKVEEQKTCHLICSVLGYCSITEKNPIYNCNYIKTDIDKSDPLRFTLTRIQNLQITTPNTVK